jgi:chromosomal replication initiator protein
MERSAEAVWKNCLSFIQDNITAQAFTTWFLPIKALKLQGKVITVQVPSKFTYEWLEAHYIKLLKSAITKELGEDAKLVYSIIMENTYGNSEPQSLRIPSTNRPPIQNPQVSMPVEIGGVEGIRNPFVIPNHL